MLDPRANELGILAYLLRAPDMLRLHGDTIGNGEGLFSYPNARTLLPFLIRGAEQEAMPTYVELARAIQTDALREGWTAIEVADLHTDLQEVYTTEVSSFTGDHLQRYFLAQAAHQVLGEMADLLKDPNGILDALPAIRERLDTMALMGGRDEDLGVFPCSEEALEDPMAWLAELYGGEAIPTGWPVLDKLLRGGWRPGELIIVMAATGVGKTLTMLNMAAACIESAALNHRGRCIYYSIDNSQPEFLERWWSRIGYIPIGVQTSNQEYASKLRVASRGGHKRFLLKCYAPNRATARDIQRHFRKARDYWYREDRRAGIPIDEAGRIHEVFIDYGDQIKPSHRKEARRFELSEIYLDFVGMSREERMAVISATQGNRFALTAETLNLAMVSEDVGKVHHASHVMGVCQTALEKSLGLLRMAMLKARRPDSGYFVRMKQDRTLQMIREMDGAKMEMIDPGSPQQTTKSDKRGARKEEQSQQTQAALAGAAQYVHAQQQDKPKFPPLPALPNGRFPGS